MFRSTGTPSSVVPNRSTPCLRASSAFMVNERRRLAFSAPPKSSSNPFTGSGSPNEPRRVAGAMAVTGAAPSSWPAAPTARGSARADPDRHRHPTGVDGLGEPGHVRRRGDRALAVHLDDERLRTVALGAVRWHGRCRRRPRRRPGRSARRCRPAPASVWRLGPRRASRSLPQSQRDRPRGARRRAMASLRTSWPPEGKMDPLQFFAACRLVIVAGKGGVGKTTVTGAMAVAAARLGRRVLVVELEGASGLGRLLGSPVPLGSDDVMLRAADHDGDGEIVGRAVSPGDALTDYLDEHGMRRLSGRLARSGVIDVVATAAPGLDDILVLGKVKQLERVGGYDLILLDAPSGRARRHLPALRQGAGRRRHGRPHRGPGPARCWSCSADADRCQVVLVTLPEEMPVNELVEHRVRAWRTRSGVQLGPVVVNGLYPERPALAGALEAAAATVDGDLAGAARFRLARAAQQARAGGPPHRRPAPAADPSALPLHGRPGARGPRGDGRCLHRAAGRARRHDRPGSGRCRRGRFGRSGERTRSSSSAVEREASGRRPRPQCSPSRRPPTGAEPSWSPSTRPAGWPTRSAWRLTNDPSRVEGPVAGAQRWGSCGR